MAELDLALGGWRFQETEGLRAEIGALKEELEGAKSALEGALKAGVAGKLEV
jgi:hypothetical protein